MLKLQVSPSQGKKKQNRLSSWKLATSFLLLNSSHWPDSFQVGGPGQAEEVKIVELHEQFLDAELTPCQTYAYQVATIVGEQESARTELVNLRVPPR